MPYLMVHHRVRDLAGWKKVFKDHESTRKERGSKGAQVFLNGEDPTDVFLLFEWDSVENAKKFGKSEDLKRAMERAGVIGIPHIHMLEEIAKTGA
jgi:hypothetical protein